MKTNKIELLNFDICKKMFYKFTNHTNNTNDDVDVASLVGSELTYSDILCLLNKKRVTFARLHKFICDCVLIDGEIITPFNSKYGFFARFVKNLKDNNHPYMVTHDLYTIAHPHDVAYVLRVGEGDGSGNYDITGADLPLLYYQIVAKVIDYVSSISEESKHKVNKLLIDLINEY